MEKNSYTLEKFLIASWIIVLFVIFGGCSNKKPATVHHIQDQPSINRVIPVYIHEDSDNMPVKYPDMFEYFINRTNSFCLNRYNVEVKDITVKYKQSTNHWNVTYNCL